MQEWRVLRSKGGFIATRESSVQQRRVNEAREDSLKQGKVQCSKEGSVQQKVVK